MKFVDTTDSAKSGFPFFTAVTIVLIILKVLGHIHWSWFWVIAPLFIPIVTTFVIIILMTIVAIIIGVVEGVYKNVK